MITNGTNGHAQDLATDYHMVQVATMEQLLQVWPFVKKGIERIKQRDKSCGSWRHNAVFNAIRFGLPSQPQRTTSVELFLALNAYNEPKGFMVTTPRLDPFANNVPIGIHVWLLYANYAMIEQFLPELVRLGKINGGDQIRFESGRLGWLRNFGRMAKLGFRVEQYVYVKDIEW